MRPARRRLVQAALLAAMVVGGIGRAEPPLPSVSARFRSTVTVPVSMTSAHASSEEGGGAGVTARLRTRLRELRPDRGGHGTPAATPTTDPAPVAGDPPQGTNDPDGSDVATPSAGGVAPAGSTGDAPRHGVSRSLQRFSV